jgi:hypothetical protein
MSGAGTSRVCLLLQWRLCFCSARYVYVARLPVSPSPLSPRLPGLPVPPFPQPRVNFWLKRESIGSFEVAGEAKEQT